jgi:voltage-gated potassium channel Kch
VRKYTAELETGDLYFQAEIADQQHRAAVTSIRALRDRLEVGRSLGPLVRLEWGQA